MSYCVNCGVELENGCPECPLCDTPVINPREKVTDNNKPIYPENINIPKSLSKKYWVFLISMIMLIPNLVMLILNSLIFDSHVVPYVTGGCVVAWIWFLFPFLWKKVMPMLLLAIDALALLTYLYTFKVFGDDSGWFALVAMPVVIAMWALGNGFIILFKKTKRKSIRTAAVLGAINIMSFVIEICLNMFYLGRLQIPVSLVVTACCVSLMIFFIVLAKSKRLNAWVSRKFFM
ncbi:MAG: hypothetical protein IJZ07_09130 [Clostridia bacterium]|nr:hypothetical protein [Clostridia bacterium]